MRSDSLHHVRSRQLSTLFEMRDLCTVGSNGLCQLILVEPFGFTKLLYEIPRIAELFKHASLRLLCLAGFVAANTANGFDKMPQTDKFSQH